MKNGDDLTSERRFGGLTDEPTGRMWSRLLAEVSYLAVEGIEMRQEERWAKGIGQRVYRSSIIMPDTFFRATNPTCVTFVSSLKSPFRNALNFIEGPKPQNGIASQ